MSGNVVLCFLIILSDEVSGDVEDCLWFVDDVGNVVFFIFEVIDGGWGLVLKLWILLLFNMYYWLSVSEVGLGCIDDIVFKNF